ncbi:hypothetical protein BGX23_006342 [Mortierella sp. AD031]|nr:hypothetical protein BGX23_006342 [Mortierella sp. AD031]KAG0207636.1 hypothetical protein BGX33_006740 [Mortierella sp. NVP41]
MQSSAATRTPPEVLERLALFLTPNSLTICIRVCRLWLHCFVPTLYQDIRVYDFDYFSSNLKGRRYVPRSDGVDRTPDTIGYGGKFVHKYGHFIKEITVGLEHSLTYLGPNCVNLEKATVAKHPATTSMFRAMPEDEKEMWKWKKYRGGENSSNIVKTLWRPLFALNQGLRRLFLNSFPERKHAVSSVSMASALGTLPNLEELHASFVYDWGALQCLFDHCPQVRKITFDVFWGKFGNTCQVFRSGTNFDTITAEPRTQVKELSIFYRSNRNRQSWIIPALWRCPLLERVDIPEFRMNNFERVVKAIVQHCPEIRYLGFATPTKSAAVPAPERILEDLLIRCRNLCSLRIWDFACFFTARNHLRDRDLRLRLQELRVTGGTLDRSIPGSDLPFGALLVCPNLRIFEAPHMTLDVLEFLEMEFVCLETLEHLHLRLRYQPSPEGEEQEGEGEGEGDGEDDPKAARMEDPVVREGVQTRVLEKLAQFRSLRTLQLGAHRKLDKYGYDIFHLEMGEQELVQLAEMPMLKSCEVDEVDYSSKLLRIRKKALLV